MSPPRPEQELSEKAVSICREHAERVVEGEVQVEVVDRKLVWDEVQLRDVFHQTMTLWRRYGSFEVIVDEDGLVAGFVDHDKYEKSLEGELTEVEVEALVAREKLVPPGSRVVELREHRVDERTRTYRATVELLHATRAYERLEVEINPTSRATIAIRPLVESE